MRVATWNMDHWRRSAELRREAWEYLRDRVQPDVALLQESLPPVQGPHVVFRQGGLHDDRCSPARDQGWGSAVVSFGPGIRPLDYARSPFREAPSPLLRTLPGSVAIAEVEGEEPLVVVSAYGVIDRGYADATVHRILSDLEPLIDERRGRRLIVAGDLNVTTQWSAKHRSFLKGRHEECLRRDRNLFDRFTALGLHNIVTRSTSTPLEGCECTLGAACRHVQTQAHERSSFPWQNDYVFVSDDLLALRPCVDVMDEGPARRLSGHFPIVVDFPWPRGVSGA